jgi:rhamnogalacturonan endolyase
MALAAPRVRGEFACVLNGQPAKVGAFNPSDIRALVVTSGNLSMTFAEDPTGEFGPVSVVYNGQELAPPDGLSTFYLGYNNDRGNLVADTVRIVEVSPKIVHIVLIDHGRRGPFYLEHHFVMKAGLSGVYGYVVVKSRPGVRGDMQTVYQFDRGVLNHSFIGTGLNDDLSGYISTAKMWGHFGNGIGVFFIPISTEYYPGGPLQRVKLLRADAILNPISSGGPVTGASGRKLFGPWLLYFDSGDTQQAMTDEARQRAAEEVLSEPYPWLSDEQYPQERTNVAGQLIIPGQQPNVASVRTAASAWVMLGKPGGDVSHQSGGYLYSAKADDAGDFWMPAVRPGHYTLYAWPGQGIITQELVKDDIVIRGDAQSLGQIPWEAPKHNNLIFQIGKSDRLSDEFKFGNEPRNAKWLQMVPGNLTFNVGQSAEGRDWYFAQCKPGKWTVRFDLSPKSETPAATQPSVNMQGQAYLSVPIAAGSVGAHATVRVNGNPVMTISPSPGDYQLLEAKFPASILKPTGNTMEFDMTTAGKAGISYDTIILESD